MGLLRKPQKTARENQKYRRATLNLR